jgi:hypothetical protein
MKLTTLIYSVKFNKFLLMLTLKFEQKTLKEESKYP